MSSGPGQVVVVGSAEESEAVGQHLEHALREDEAALLGAGAEDLEDELLFAHPGGAGHFELLGDARQLGDAHLLEVTSSMTVGLRSASAGRRLLSSLAISIHSSFSPSPVTAENGQHGRSERSFEMRAGRVSVRRASACQSWWPRRQAESSRDTSQSWARRSLSRPGCRPSTSSRPRRPPEADARTRRRLSGGAMPEILAVSALRMSSTLAPRRRAHTHSPADRPGETGARPSASIR